MNTRAKKTAVPRRKVNVYKMPEPIPEGEVIIDSIAKRKWRIGPSIAVGGFGEIYSACDHDSRTAVVKYPYVVKIEPHENGPLFVEKNFYIRCAKKEDIKSFMKTKKISHLGMPLYYGNGTHEYKGEKYRYLVLERYGNDVWSLVKAAGGKIKTRTVFLLGLQMLDVLEYIHSKGYVHADIKGANILISLKTGLDNQAFLVDFGLASRINDKEFKPDPKCAHNGTIEYTSRDAHSGVATMRGDFEILGYNMLQWIIGELPWEQHLKQPNVVKEMKCAFMNNVRTEITNNYKDVPEDLIKFFEYINSLRPKDPIDYTKCQKMFENVVQMEGSKRGQSFDFDSITKRRRKKSNDNIHITRNTRKQNGAVKSVDQERNSEEDCPSKSLARSSVQKKKRKSIEPSVVANVKRTRLAPKATPPKATPPKATPPAKTNHSNIATQTSNKKPLPSRSQKTVSFDSPVSEIFGENTNQSDERDSMNTSEDVFDDSFIEMQKVKKKRSIEVVTFKRITKHKTTTGKPKGKTWKDCPSIINGRSPPK